MDVGEDSSRYGTVPPTSDILSSSSSRFFSADDTNITMDSLDTDWLNSNSESLANTSIPSKEVDPCTSSDPRKFTSLSSYGIHHSRHKGKSKKIGRLLEISPPLPPFSRLRSCDVFIGFHGRKPLLLRFANWLRAELEVQGLSCFITDRARCRNSRKHGIVEKAMDASSFGVVILTRKSFRNPYTIEELKFFSSKKNLVPLYFDITPKDILARDIIEKRGEIWERYGGELWVLYGGDETEWRDAVNSLSCVDDWKLEACNGRLRDCVLRSVTLLALRLGRRSVVDRLTKWREKAEREEFPFLQNESFVGRKRELTELEFMLFGDVCGDGERDYFELEARPKSRRKNSKMDETSSNKRKGKGKVMWKESDKEIEMQKTDFHLTPRRKQGRTRKRSMNIVYGKGIACVTGDPGIGKTELVLEYAYRYHQRYKMVLWIGGESRYIRQNYLNLRSFLEVDVGVESSTERGRTKSFEEQEEAAVARVRKELMRSIPFLLIIDNLESEKDWWDHKMVMDLLPRFGGETHVIITTHLSNVMNLEPLRLSFLSGVEAMTLMQGGLKDHSITEMDALRAIEEKLGRLTLGLAMVGAILSELPINPSRLLETINRMPSRDITWSGCENHALRRNIFLVQLFEVCFSIFDHAEGPGSLATRMVLASGWFAPGPVPLQILALAGYKIPESKNNIRLWKKIMYTLTCGFGFTSSYARLEAEASSLLLRFNMARSCTKDGHVKLNDLLKLYARKRGVTGVAEAMVQSVIASVSVSEHPDHIWAACFLLLGFGKDPIVVNLKVTQLVSLVKQVVLPLAIRTFITFSRCSAAVEVLRLCTDALEAADQAFATPVEKWLDKSCWWKPIHTSAELNPYLWQELALTRATVLEVRAKLMARGGQLDIADDLIRKAIFIRSSICGHDHPNTIAAQETLSKFTRLSATLQSRTSP